MWILGNGILTNGKEYVIEVKLYKKPLDADGIKSEEDDYNIVFNDVIIAKYKSKKIAYKQLEKIYNKIALVNENEVSFKLDEGFVEDL